MFNYLKFIKKRVLVQINSEHNKRAQDLNI